jgi:hypothetical protein
MAAAQAIGTILLAWLVGVTAARNKLMTTILAALTIAVLLYGGDMFAGKSAYARNVESGFVIAMVVVMIIVQGIL